MEGWIKLHRKFLEWEWFDKPEMVQLYLYLLLKAGREPKQWQGLTINAGQIVTSYDKIAKHTSLSVQTIRTCIKRLKSTGELTSEATNKYSIITICKYGDYQEAKIETNKQANKEANSQATSDQQAANKQLTTNKNIKNINKENNSKELQKKKDAARAATIERKESFYQSLAPFASKYQAGMMQAFFEYWSEMNQSQTKMRYEKQPTWEIAKRLSTWASRSGTGQNSRMQAKILVPASTEKENKLLNKLQ